MKRVNLRNIEPLDTASGAFAAIQSAFGWEMPCKVLAYFIANDHKLQRMADVLVIIEAAIGNRWGNR